MNPYILTLAFVGLCLVHTGLAIDCHQCSSKDGPGCDDYYKLEDGEGNIDGCEDTDTHCLKLKFILHLADSGAILGKDTRSVTVSRGCERASGGDSCSAITTTQGVLLKCVCTTDNCNGVAERGSSLVLLLLTLAVVLGIRKML